MQMSVAENQRVASWLARGGLRPTRQRMALAALLIADGKDRHVSAESLFKAATQAGEMVSLATVYNTLRAFSEARLLREINVNGAKSHFDTRMDDHPHFFWEDTQKLTDAPVDSLEISRLPEPPDGTEIVKLDVVIRLRKA